MQLAYNQFLQIMQDTMNVGILHRYLHDFYPTPIDYSDLLRLQWTQSVSAFDKLIHDFVRIAMLEIYNGNRARTPAFENFTISLDYHERILSYPLYANQYLESLIIQKHGYLSFQSPDKVAEALSYIWDEQHKWSRITIAMGKPASEEQTVKTTLNNIVIRRNQIVHEGDFPSQSSSRQSISDTDVNSVILFINDVSSAIFNLVR